jgi:hypothetical protein
MEEILSSIRRIIADEANDQEGEQDAAGAPEGYDRDVDAPELDAENASPDDDVLELTEVVQDDGEVIDLDRSLAQPRSIEPQPVEVVAKQRPQIQLDPGERDNPDPGDDDT